MVEPSGSPATPRAEETTSSDFLEWDPQVIIDQIFPGYTAQGPGFIVQGHSAEGNNFMEEFVRRNPSFCSGTQRIDPMLPAENSQNKLSFYNLTPSGGFSGFTGLSGMALSSQASLGLMQCFNDLANPNPFPSGSFAQTEFAGTPDFGESNLMTFGDGGKFVAFYQPEQLGFDLQPLPRDGEREDEEEDSGHGDGDDMSRSLKEEEEEDDGEEASLSPCTDLDDPGNYGFSLHFPKGSDKKFIYDANLKKAFLKRSEMWDVQFTFQKKPPAGSTVEVTAIRDDVGHVTESVRACPKPHDKETRPDEKRHFLLVKGTADIPGDDKVTLGLSLKTAQDGAGWKTTTQLACGCTNSCFGAKSRIILVFKVMAGGSTQAGVKRVEIRSCMCPSRDHANAVAEAARPKHAKGRKRGAQEMVNGDANTSPAMKAAPTVAAPPPRPPTGPIPFITGGCSAWKKMKGKSAGMSQNYYKEGNSLCLDVHVRIDASLEAFVKPVLANLDILRAVQAMPQGKSVPMSQLLRSRSGMRPSLTVAPTAADVNADEIRRWIEDIVHVTEGITEKLFVCRGVASLEQIFKLTKEKLDIVMAEFKEEVVDKFWHAVQEKKRPPISPQIFPASQGK